MDLNNIKTRLESISNFVFHSSSNNKMNGLEGMGGGEVKCVLENENALLFYENGRFNNSFNKSMKCNNIYRWSFNYLDNKIALQHLLIVNDTIVIKHWRQDWVFENKDIYRYYKDNEWIKETLTAE